MLWQQVPVPPTPPAPLDIGRIIVDTGSPPPWVTLPPHVVGLIVLGFLAACTVVLWPLVRAFARRLEGRGTDAVLRAEVEELRSRVHELESHQGRFAELEERLDFAERLLARHREPIRLPEG